MTSNVIARKSAVQLTTKQSEKFNTRRMLPLFIHSNDVIGNSFEKRYNNKGG